MENPDTAVLCVDKPREGPGPARNGLNFSRRRLRLLAWTALTLSLPASAPHAEGLSLESVVRLALERNERARSAEARLQAAEARVDNARAFFLPDLVLVGNYTRRAYETTRVVGGVTSVIQRYNALSPTATMTMSIFDARSLPLYQQIKGEQEAARFTTANDKRLLTFDAAEAFLTALSAEQVAEAAQRRLDFARKSLKDARARFEAQIVSSNDVTRAELELATAERELTGAQGGVKTARLRLGYLLDTGVEGPLETPVALLQAVAGPPGVGDDLIAQAQKRRADVAATRQHAEALRLSAQEPLLRLFPNLGFTGQFKATNETGLSGHRYDGFGGLALNWRLYDGGKFRADRAERLALARAADLDLRASERRVALEVRTALVALANQQATINQASVAVDVAQKNTLQTAELYRQGLASELQVADANVRLFEAEVALARARYGLALAYLDLRAATGLSPLGEESTP